MRTGSSRERGQSVSTVCSDTEGNGRDTTSPEERKLCRSKPGDEEFGAFLDQFGDAMYGGGLSPEDIAAEAHRLMTAWRQTTP